MNKLYVFEGVDGSGKTSIAQGFAHAINGTYYKGLPRILKPFKNWVDAYLPPSFRYRFYVLGNHISYRELLQLLQHSDVVIDQYIYCTMAFHTVSMKKKLKESVPKVTPTHIIYLSATWDEIDKRLDERGGRKKLERLSYLKEVDNVYRTFLTGLPNVIYCNTDGKSISESVQLLLNTITEP